MTNLPRRTLLLLTLASAALTPLSALAQDSKPIEWVVGYAPGGGSDIVARTVGEAMGKALGRTIIVNNKPGAATNIAADYVAKSRDPGSVMLSADFATLAVNPWLFSKLSYNAEQDFAPVGLLARFPMILVAAPNVPANNLKEFLAWASQQPSGVNFASAGIGSPHHLAGELLREATGLKLTHVAYRGAAPAIQDLLGGQVSVGLMDSAAVQPHLAGGKLKVIGVASAQRVKVFPNIPTLAEQGLKGFEAYAWQGLAVPAATPPDQIAALNKALQTALDATPVKARFQTLGLEALPGTPEQMSRYARAENLRWGKLIRDNNIKLD